MARLQNFYWLISLFLILLQKNFILEYYKNNRSHETDRFFFKVKVFSLGPLSYEKLILLSFI